MYFNVHYLARLKVK